MHSSPNTMTRSRPLLSVVLVVYNMAEQAKNTLTSLSAGYQVGVSPEDYEVVIVENSSTDNIRKAVIDDLPENFRYFLRSETEPTPVHAVNFGASQARGENICIMIDGARMLTPGLIKNTILGHGISSAAVVTVPSYHLGHQIQQEAVKTGYGVHAERHLLSSISWPEQGYRLFEIACFSRSSEPGIFLPNSESNSISMPKEIWDKLGGCDPSFNMCGGGFVNLDLYKQACAYPDVQHVILPGEGTFHQYHGGVTTGGKRGKDRDTLMLAIINQYRELRGEDYFSPVTTPVYLGEISTQAQKFVLESSKRIAERELSYDERLSQHKKAIIRNPSSKITRFHNL
jgi:glycosyltransferase involved in cell wall biosynthesis